MSRQAASFTRRQENMNTVDIEAVTKLCMFSLAGDLDKVKSLSEVLPEMDVNAGDYDQRTALHLASSGGHLSIVKYLVEECGAKLQRDNFGMLPIHDARRYGFSEVAEYLQDMDFSEMSARSPREQMFSTVLSLVVKEGVFSYGLVYDETDYFFNSMGLHHKYFHHFTPAQVARHIHCLLAAKKVAQTTKSQIIKFHMEDPHSGFYLNTLDSESALETEGRISRYLAKDINNDTCFSVTFVSSDAPAIRGGSKKLGIYIVDRTFFEHHSPAELEDEDDLNIIASTKFLKNKTVESQRMYQKLIRKLLSSRSTFIDIAPVSEPDEDGMVMMFAVYETTYRTYIREINQVFRHCDMVPKRLYVETFANGIVTYMCYYNNSQEAEIRRVAEMLKFVTHFKSTPGRSQLIWDLVMKNTIDAPNSIFLLAGVKYVFTFFPKETSEYLDLAEHLKNDSERLRKLDEVFMQSISERLTTQRIYQALAGNIEICKMMYDDFSSIAHGLSKPKFNQKILGIVNETVSNAMDRKILRCLLTFNENLRMTNFFKQGSSPSAIAFRFHSDVLKGRPSSLFPEMPFGVYMIMGRGFYGFHIRFRDVARGGIRLIRSRDAATYERNSQTVFLENYNLAYTQQQKNKDIPEGGSKGTILLDSDWATGYPRVFSHGKDSFFKYIDALLDCMLPEQNGIYSHLQNHEFLYFGPDEGTAEFMDMGALRAKERGYPYWKALTTGKSTHFGGVPHDVYGMTTTGVHMYVVELLRYMGEDETKITKFMTGGPDGDLGSNEILLSQDKTVGIVDGSGVAYDPAGLNRTELVRLAKKRGPIAEFSSGLIGEGGFIVRIDDSNITLPDGSHFRTGAEVRDKFHLLDYSAADLFVPCGGRPAAVNKNNVQKMFINGKPKYKYIVEGANLFFTDDARRVMEAAGVHHFKDASANKGGVTSSSLEVFSALCMYDDEHQELLTIGAGESEAPQFYKDYVNEILDIIKANARMEFHTIMKAVEATGKSKVELTKEVSTKINKLGDYISSVLDENQDIMVKVLRRAIPRLLLEKFGLQHIAQCSPASYLQAMAAVWIASRYVYCYGIDATEFSFYRFMRAVEMEDFTEVDALEAEAGADFKTKDATSLNPICGTPRVKQLQLKERSASRAPARVGTAAQLNRLGSNESSVADMGAKVHTRNQPTPENPNAPFFKPPVRP